MQKQKLIIIFIFVALIAFFLGKFFQSGGQAPLTSPSSSKVASNELFRSQTATFQGEITKVSKDSLDVKTDTGTTGNFKLSSKVYIYKFAAGAPQATSSTDLSTIESGKRVLIILELSDSQYKVVSISFQPAPATQTPTKSPIKKKP